MDRPPHLSVVGESARGVPAPGEIALTIDCEECVGLHTSACADCVVTHLIGHAPGTRVELDRDEVHQLELLSDAGLVPESQFRSRHGVA